MLVPLWSDAGAKKLESPIRSVDFTNFRHHQFWGRRPIKLKQGKMEFEADGCRTEYKLKYVKYVDLTGDQSEEALVHVQDFTACGSQACPTITTLHLAKHPPASPVEVWH